MPVSNARDPLDRALLDRLGQRAGRYQAEPGLLAEDLELLRDRGYLKIAAPASFGGMGLTLPQVACAQRRLAYNAPAVALAVNAHHAWVGAAAGVHNGGDSPAGWLLREAARGRLFAGPGGAAHDLLAADPRLPPGPPGDPFTARVFGWGLPLDGEVCYAIARRAFDLATERARLRVGAGVDSASAPGGGLPADLADAALRLESVRDQLDTVLHGWRERARAGGAVSSLDPGGLWLIRLFTVRHVAATGARRVAELSAQALGETTGRIPA